MGTASSPESGEWARETSSPHFDAERAGRPETRWRQEGGHGGEDETATTAASAEVADSLPEGVEGEGRPEGPPEPAAEGGEGVRGGVRDEGGRGGGCVRCLRGEVRVRGDHDDDDGAAAGAGAGAGGEGDAGAGAAGERGTGVGGGGVFCKVGVFSF